MKRKMGWTLVLILTLGGGILLSGCEKGTSTKASSAEPSQREEKQLYTCGMHPQVIQDKPGTCPICGMNLVPLKIEETNQTENSHGEHKTEDKEGWEDVHAEHKAGPAVRLPKGLRQTVGVVTAPAEKKPLDLSIRTVGMVDYNEKAVVWVTTKYSGWIEKVYVNYVGEEVKKGQKLFEIYSPDVVSTQEELLSALRYVKRLGDDPDPDGLRQAESLLNAARERLRYWDLPESYIRSIEKAGKTRRTIALVSPFSGVIVEKMDATLEGMKIDPGMNLYKIADLSTVWVHADIFEYQVPWIKKGQKAKVDMSYFPGEVFEAKVLFIYPEMSKKTRTLRVCLELPNADGKLRAEMYTNVSLIPEDLPVILQVPKEAVIRGKAEDIVIIDKGDGSFEPRMVRLGAEGNETFAVLSGLSVGEQVVISSQFLLDSESNLKEAIQKLLGDRAKDGRLPPGMGGHQH